MAKVTSGSFNTTAYSNRYLTFSWTCTQNIEKNQSTISWSLVGAGSASGYYKAAPFEVKIADEVVYSSSTRIQLWNGTKVASGTKVITHNTDGAKSFSASVKAAIYSAAVNVSGSKTWELKDIPRKATLSTATNFNDEENPTITYTNPAGTAVTTLQACISFDKSADNIAYRDISKTGTSYTFNLTSAERETLRKACTTANSMTVYFYIKTVISGTTFYSSLTRTLTIKDGSATLSPVVEDTNEKTLTLTGDKNKLIKYYSNAKATSGAAARKHATISSQSITNNSTEISAASGTFNKVESAVFDFSVKDSRKNTVTKQVTKTLINYIKLTCNLKASATLESDNTAKVSFTISGNYFNGSFGAVTNSLKIYYRYKKDNGEFTGWKSTDITPTSNKYSNSFTLTGLDYRSTYTIEAAARDKLWEAYDNYKYSEAVVVKAQPIFDWSSEDFNFNVPVTANGVKLFYTSGDSFSLQGTWCNFAGCISDGTTTLYLTIPLSKPVLANSVSFDGYIIGRGINGYVNGTGFNDSTAINLKGSSNYTVTNKISDVGIELAIKFNAAVANANNNTPVNFHPYGTLTITFN